MDVLRPGTLVGPYTIVEALPQGQGGMARVYKAGTVLPATGDFIVALKVMRTGARDPQEERVFFEALNNEVEILRRLRHPNVIRIYPIPLGTHRSTPFMARAPEIPGNPWYFVMEYLDGGSLRSELKRRKRLRITEAVEVASQIGVALEYIHSKDIAHRDVKPDNILFRANFSSEARIQPVLIDFGIAAKLERLGLRAGSLHYMSPERLLEARGEIAPEQVTDHAAVDVYGLGALLYQMLTGHLPFEGHSRDSITSAILHTAPTLPRRYNPEIPPRLEHLVMRAMEKQPSHRPSAEEMIAWIEQALPPPWISVPQPEGPRGARSNQLLPWVISGVTTACLVAVLAWNSLSVPWQPASTDTPTQAIGSTNTPTSSAVPIATTTTMPVLPNLPTNEPTGTATPTSRPQAASLTPGPVTPTSVPTRTPTNTFVPPSPTPVE